MTHLFAYVADDHKPSMADVSSGLGHALDGTLRQYGQFHHTALTHAPLNLSFEQAATLFQHSHILEYGCRPQQISVTPARY